MKRILMIAGAVTLAVAFSSCEKHNNCFLCEYPDESKNETICGGVDKVPQAQSDCVAAGGKITLE